MAGFFITGTDTGVGKTVVTALLARIMQNKYSSVGVYKPVESGGRLENGCCSSQDMEFVKNKSGLSQDLTEMNTYCFPQPVAPHLAARLNNQEIEPEKILFHYKKLIDNYDRVLVEGAGGICVPITGTGLLIADLAKLLNLPVIIVARPDLGTVNHTILTVKYAQSAGLTVKGIIINYSRRLAQTIVEDTNPGYIEQLAQVPVLAVVPYLENYDFTKLDKHKLGRIAYALGEASWHG